VVYTKPVAKVIVIVLCLVKGGKVRQVGVWEGSAKNE